MEKILKEFDKLNSEYIALFTEERGAPETLAFALGYEDAVFYLQKAIRIRKKIKIIYDEATEDGVKEIKFIKA